MKCVLFLAVVALTFSNKGLAQSGATIFDRSYVHEIKVYFSDPAFWDTLELHYANYSSASGAFNEADKQYMLADSILLDGFLLDSVGVRQKGNSSNWAVSSERKPLKIDFKEFKNQKFEGLKKLNLSNSYSDRTLLCDMIAYEFYRKLGIPAPRVSFAKLFLNDQYWGLYNCVEQIDTEFLEDHFDMADGDLYKPHRINALLWHGSDWTQYQDTFNIRTNEGTTNHSDFYYFLDKLNTTSDANFETTLHTILNVPQYLNFLAAEIIVNNPDGHLIYNRNNYMYFDLESGKFHFLPWDHNYSFNNLAYPIILDYSTMNLPLPSADNVLITRVQENTSLRYQYFNAMCFALNEISLEKMEPIIDSMVLLTKDLALNDPYLSGSPWSLYNENIYNSGISEFKALFNQRITQIMEQFNLYGYNCALGTEDVSKEGLSIYPNPTESQITIKTKVPFEIASVYDIYGKLILQTHSDVISLDGLTAGQYLIEVRTNSEIHLEKIIKQ